MSRQIEQALFSLMPTCNSDLPAPLLELAGSLLAQSRNAVSTLKAEEEIARTYACANIACDRLKITLDLPPIQPRPPIPPRNYKKLYTHLDTALPSNSTPGRQRPPRTRTPSSRATATEPRPLPSRATPTKESSLSLFRTADPPTKSTGRAVVGTGLPAWVKAVSRFICVETHQQHLATTVVAGMDAIVAPVGIRTDDPWINQNFTPLLAAVYFHVTIKVVALETEQEMTKEPFAAQRREILKLLSRAQAEVTVNATGHQDPWEGWDDVKPREFNSAVTQVEEQGWLDSDWFKGLADVVGGKDLGKIEIVNGDDEDEDLPIQVRRADTMFHDKYDYLSEARQADYTTWKMGILHRISKLRAAGNSIEIDTQ